MSDGRLWKTPNLVPTIAYEDVPGAIDWLCRAFGFTERSEARLSGEGWVRAWLEYGDALVCLTTVAGSELSSAKDGRTSQATRLYVDDVDSHFDQARAAGATISTELEDRFSGGRRYQAWDHEGHLWEFAQASRELDASLWKLPAGVKLGA